LVKPLNQNRMKEIEEAAEKYLQEWRLLNNIHLSNPIHAERCKNDFIAGAKWMLDKLQDFDTWKEWKDMASKEEIIVTEYRDGNIKVETFKSE
jgi:nicotinic acid mononucleotide adenylyltransferase